MEELLAPMQAMLDVGLVDLASRKTLYDSFPVKDQPAAFDRTLDLGLRRYGIDIAPTQAYLASHRAWQSWAVLAAGLFSTSLLGALLMLATGHARRVEMLVDERTQELEAANQRLRIEIEERLQTEAALRRAQRIEALGQLTGGIAHDFNNLLAVIIGNAEMARRRPEDGRVPDLLDKVLRAGQRGAALTRQLLTFSRHQAVSSRTVDLHAEIPRAVDVLRTSLRGDIELTLSMADDLWLVDIDPGELEIALLNIAVNARDAMPDGGRFAIELYNAIVRPGDIADTPQLRGENVVISLRDNGVGIPHDILPKVLEPFFTTKDVGAGTGLGLSQVYGFMRQSSGHIVIESEPGTGTRVALYLPRTRKPLLRPTHLLEPSGQTSFEPARILLVEDDADVAQVTATMLRAMGFEVESVDGARKALDWLARGEHADLLLADVLMPGGMNGHDLATEVSARLPDLPIILMSGYNNAGRLLHRSEFSVLQKPVRFAELETALRRQLATRPPPLQAPLRAGPVGPGALWSSREG
ncbi:MAG: ATP-binding protein [Pseudomonadota bacterium]|nr:ATP-binding protein [Pseudomonadota bacterium]